MKVPVWAWIAWIVTFLVLEGIAVYDAAPNDTLTQTTLHHVPAAIIVGFLAWLTVHFTTRVWRNRRGKQDGL